MAKRRRRWLQVLKPLSPRAKLVIGCLSFVLPILLWCIVSYVPFVWHPKVLVENPGSVDYFEVGTLVDRSVFESEVAEAIEEKLEVPTGSPANPLAVF